MQLDSIVDEWLTLGRTDLAAGRFLLKMRPVPDEIICFHSQQAVEKHLKAVLVLHDTEPPKVHDLMFLLSTCLPFAPELEEIRRSCAALSDYAVSTRYPAPTRIEVEAGQRSIEMATSAADRIAAVISRIRDSRDLST